MEISRLRSNLAVGERTMQVMERCLAAHLARPRRGPPMRHAARFVLLVALMRLRTALPLRLLARLFLTDHVTLWRHCGLATRFLSGMFESPGGARELIVDTTATRVRSTDGVWYSGHKKREGAGPVRRRRRRPFRLASLRRERPRQGDLGEGVQRSAERCCGCSRRQGLRRRN